jgi:hypothetical protein
LQSLLTNYFYPQQKLVFKVRDGAKVSKKYDTATTPHRRAERHQAVCAEDKAILADTYASINPAAVQRQIQALTAELLTITTSKAGPKTKATAIMNRPGFCAHRFTWLRSADQCRVHSNRPRIRRAVSARDGA